MPCVAAARAEALAALAAARRLAACAAAAPRRAARGAPSPAASALPPKLAGGARPADSGGSWKSDQSVSASPHPEDSASAEQAPPRAAKRARRGADGASTPPPAAPRLPVRRALFGAPSARAARARDPALGLGRAALALTATDPTTHPKTPDRPTTDHPCMRDPPGAGRRRRPPRLYPQNSLPPSPHG
jgi:hypothetical protein